MSANVWAYKKFRLAYAANLTSTLGSAFSPVGVSFAVIGITGSTTYLGCVLAAGITPRLILLPVAGAVADRYSRTHVMIAASALSALAQGLVVLLISTAVQQIWVLIALVAVTGAASAFFKPAAEGILPLLVPPGLIRQANVQFRICTNACVVLGPAVAGALIGATHRPELAILVDALSFVAAIPLLSFLRLPPRQVLATGVIGLLRGGWTEFWSHTWLWVVVLQSAVTNVGDSTAFRLLGPVVAQRLYGGAATWGLLVSVQGIGYLLGGVVSIWFKPRRLLRAGVGCAAGVALPGIAMALSSPLPVLLAADLMSGVLNEQYGVAWATALCQHVPEQLLSRVSSYDLLGSQMLIPVGYLVGGTVVGHLGIDASLWWCVVLILVPTVLALLSRQVRILEQPCATAVSR
ncbi:MAG: transrane efflux protein [Nocardia sp.]|uniref:MFS transporter n=1 Tax=Nocardia sp. TaxID=1821 RepID=UPI0026150473|nr:MFS transporter [Nocardia sp.]MCU1644065.1 transrane efflux protein [Nocardia sp.]